MSCTLKFYKVQNIYYVQFHKLNIHTCTCTKKQTPDNCTLTLDLTDPWLNSLNSINLTSRSVMSLVQTWSFMSSILQAYNRLSCGKSNRSIDSSKLINASRFFFIYSYTNFPNLAKSSTDILYGKFCSNFFNRYHINILLILFWPCNNSEDIGSSPLGRPQIPWRSLFSSLENRRSPVITDINTKIFNKTLNM